MQEGAWSAKTMRGKGSVGKYTKQPDLRESRKEESQRGLGRRATGRGKEQEAAGGRGGEAVVRRYHGRLQGRRLLGWAYETVFVVALWLRQENRWFSSSRVTKAAQVRLPDLPCPLAWPGGARAQVASIPLRGWERWLER